MGLRDKINDEEILLLEISCISSGQPYVPCPENPENISHKVYTRRWNLGQDRERDIFNGRVCSVCGKIYSVGELLELYAKPNNSLQLI